MTRIRYLISFFCILPNLHTAQSQPPHSVTCSEPIVDGNTVMLNCAVHPWTTEVNDIVWTINNAATTVFLHNNVWLGEDGQTFAPLAGRASSSYTHGQPSISFTILNATACDTTDYTLLTTVRSLTKRVTVNVTVPDIAEPKKILNMPSSEVADEVVHVTEGQNLVFMCYTIDFPRARDVTWEKRNLETNEAVDFTADERLGSLEYSDYGNCTYMYNSSRSLNVTAVAGEFSVKYICIITRYDGAIDDSTVNAAEIKFVFSQTPSSSTTDSTLTTTLPTTTTTGLAPSTSTTDSTLPTTLPTTTTTGLVSASRDFAISCFLLVLGTLTVGFVVA